MPSKRINVPPLIAIPHNYISTLIKQYKPKSVIDMGGRGRLKKFLECKVLDANISGKPKINGENLPFAAKSFDVAVSINTMEHVNKQYKFLQESVRVAKKAIVHFYLCGKYAKIIEDYKKSCGHRHKHVLPKKEHYNKLIKENAFSVTKFYPIMSCREHLLLLTSMFSYMNRISTYKLIDRIGEKPYSYVLHCEK